MGFRRFYKTLHTALALGYLLLGMAAMWHAPHFSQARASIDVDRHAEHEAVFGSDCALCTVKTTPQWDGSRQAHGIPGLDARASGSSAYAFAATPCVFTGRPRAPPFLS